MTRVLIFCSWNPSRGTSDFVTVSQSVSQSDSQSVCQSVSQTVSQSVSYSVLCDLKHLLS